MTNCVFCNIDRGNTQNQPCACGNYKIVDSWNFNFPKYSEENKLKISIFLRQLAVNNFDIRIIGTKPSTPQIFIQWSNRDEKQLLDEKTIDEIIKAPTLVISERFNRALLNIAKKSQYRGASLIIDSIIDYPMLYPDSSDTDAVRFILIQLLEDKYISLHYDYNESYLHKRPFKLPFTITPKGWNKVAELESTNKDSKKVFVAMWFSDEMKETFEKYIQSAVAEAKEGHNALHIGKKEHNNDINDEIIAEIKTSKFVIADLTGDRGGVYYEAGFAKGLGIPVIFTCHSDWFNKEIIQKVEDKDDQAKAVNIKINRKVHFDVSTINIIEWKTGEELKTKLINRIRATID